MKRRTLLSATTAFPAILTGRRHTGRAQDAPALFQYPIAWPESLPGNGFIIRHGYACENTWYNPGYLHTAEDWYALADETAGAGVRAIAPGRVVFAGSDYPGRVVIIQHDTELFSMYGHLDYSLAIADGEDVALGQLLGTVLFRTDGRAPSHLHFEIRTFLTTPEVNGERPLYGSACGYNCAPGPGYWPIDASEHPSAMGWRNPTHVIARRSRVRNQMIVAEGIDETVPLWSLPSDRTNAEQIGDLALAAGDQLTLTAIAAGPEATSGWSAERYRLWYEVAQPDGASGWVQAAVPSDIETGSDGRPSSIIPRLFPT